MRTRSAFTLIEVMIVVAIISVLAATVMPRLGLGMFNEKPVSAFQRAVESASELAMSGVSVRFVLKTSGIDTDFSSLKPGAIAVEAYLKQDTDSDISKFLGTNSGREVLAWTPIELERAPTGDNWLMDPGVIYFFTDGSCTPARVSWSQSNQSNLGSSASDMQDVFYLTVTGYCAAPPVTQSLFSF